MSSYQREQSIFLRPLGTWLAYATARTLSGVNNLYSRRCNFAGSILAMVALTAVSAALPAQSTEVVHAKGVAVTPLQARSSHPTNHISLTAPACRVFLSQILPNAADRGDARTDQLVVIRNGKTLFDWNDGVVRKDAARGMWSVSKTLTATLIGTAVQDGKIKLDDPVVRYLPELLTARGADVARLKQIKIRDLLAMTSGFRWLENPRAPAQEQTDLPFLFSEGYRDLVRYVGVRWALSHSKPV